MSDWTTDAADAIDRAVALAREKTVVPARAVTKAVTYGLLAALLVIPAVVLLIAGMFRALDRAVPGRGLGLVAHARRNLRGRRGVPVGQAERVITHRTNPHERSPLARERHRE